MADYASDREGVHADLMADGVAAVLHRTVGAVFNGGEGKYVGGTPLSVNTFALIKQYKMSEVDGTVIQRGDLKVMVSAQPFFLAGLVPETGDLVDMAGQTLRVMNSTALSPGGVDIFYWLQLRK